MHGHFWSVLEGRESRKNGRSHKDTTSDMPTISVRVITFMIITIVPFDVVDYVMHDCRYRTDNQDVYVCVPSS